MQRELAFLDGERGLGLQAGPHTARCFTWNIGAGRSAAQNRGLGAPHAHRVPRVLFHVEQRFPATRSGPDPPNARLGFSVAGRPFGAFRDALV